MSQTALADKRVQLQDAVVEFGQHSLEAVSSYAWLWPIRGILFALTNPRVFTSAYPAIGRALLISAGVFSAIAFFLYLPQAAFLTLFTGPFGPVLALVLVGAESVFALSVFARQLFLAPALTEVFDATLRARGQGELVLRGRKAIGAAQGSEAVGRALVSPLQNLSFDGIVRFFLTMWFNLIPFVGTAAFVLYNGSKGGPGWHSRYFQLKGMSKTQRQAFIKPLSPQYTAFGSATLLLNFIPFIGLLFAFTNTIGAALWAAELEASSNVLDASKNAAVKDPRKSQ